MSDTIQERVHRLIQELLNCHIEVFLVLLAEAGVPHDEQRVRTDRLVRGLQNARLEPALYDGTRPAPTLLDTTHDPPRIRLSAELLAQVDEPEILSALSRPVATLLGVSPVTVGLVMRERDERQLKALATHAARGLAVPPARLTEIRAIVEARVELFVDRMHALLLILAPDPPRRIEGAGAFVSQLMASASAWPEWFDVDSYPFVLETIAWAEAALAGAEEVPPATLLVELCWEGTALSTQSFLGAAARALRSHQGPIDRKNLLHILAHVATRGEAEVATELAHWPAFAELSGAWDVLWKLEQALAGSRNADMAVPAVSVFDPPGEAMGLSEPETLPWSMPLLCWTVRERNALRDLLLGLTKSLGSHPAIGSPPTVYLDLDSAPPSGLTATAGRFNIGVQALGVDAELPPDYEALLGRALSACFATTRMQYDRLDEASRQRVFNLVLGAYTGYMPQARAVWQRRFHRVRDLPLTEGFARLVTQLHHILRLPVLFDPFEDPFEPYPMPMPAFNLVVALPDGAEKVPVHIPLGALRPSLGNAPLRLRVVRVPAAPGAPCTWLCDHELTLAELRSQQPDAMLRAVQNDILRMMVYH